MINCRILNCYERIAQQEHWCERCHGPIMSGEMYNGTVCAYKKYHDGKRLSWVSVSKKHTELQDCHDPELDLEIHRVEEANMQREEAEQSLTLLTLLARTRRIQA